MKELKRTWQTVCGDCLNYGKTTCRFFERLASPDDSIAAICEDFAPDQDDAQAQGGEPNE